MSWFYEGFIAVESMVVVSSMVAATNGNEELAPKAKLRFIFYHAFTVLAASATSLYVIVAGDFTLLESWCWIRTAAMRVYIGYLPIWGVMVLILLCDSYIFWTVYQSIAQVRMEASKRALKLQQLEVSPSPSPSSDSISGRTISNASTMSSSSGGVFAHRGMIMRFALGPLLMVLLHIPGSILRLSQMASTHIDLSDSETTFWASAQALCDPMHGAISAIVWMFTDRAVCEEWACFLRGRAGSREEGGELTENRQPASYVTDSPLRWEQQQQQQQQEREGSDLWQLRWSRKTNEEDGAGATDGEEGIGEGEGIRLSAKVVAQHTAVGVPNSKKRGSAPSADDKDGNEEDLRNRYSDEDGSFTPGVYANPLLFMSDSSKRLSNMLAMSFGSGFGDNDDDQE
jgi:hypothetical protein